jgi:hypothetical protein
VGSGVIYAVIVALWAVFLVPMWLRRHDSEAEVRQVDRFTRAMGSLRRGPRPAPTASAAESSATASERFTGSVIGPEEVAARTANAGPLTVLSLGPRRKERNDDEASASPSEVFVSRPRSAHVRDARAARLRRRRRVLLGLGGLLVLTGLLAGFGVVGLYAPVVALVVSGGYLVMLRRYALADARERRAAARVASRPFVSAIDLTAPAAGSAPESQAATSARDTVVLDRGSIAEGLEAGAAQEGAARWSPSGPPLPTYVTAPAATTVPRVIDRADAGGLTASRMVELAEAARLASGIDASPADDAVWAEATDRDAVFDREFFEAGVARDGFADAVADEVEQIVAERPRRRHPSHDVGPDAATA